MRACVTSFLKPFVKKYRSRTRIPHTLGKPHSAFVTQPACRLTLVCKRSGVSGKKKELHLYQFPLQISLNPRFGLSFVHRSQYFPAAGTETFSFIFCKSTTLLVSHDSRKHPARAPRLPPYFALFPLSGCRVVSILH